jgi:CRISPR system Cascade subunit CasE
VDEWQGGQAWALVVQSQRAPEWGWLARDQWRGYLAQVDGNPACKEWQPNLRAGQALAFRLRANPTLKRNGDRLGLFKQEDQEAWLQRKLAAAGARLLRVQMRPEGMSQGFAHDDAGKTLHMKLFAVRMDGVLQVLEPLPLAAAMEAGIGSGKGFGFGLLSLAPV